MSEPANGSLVRLGAALCLIGALGSPARAADAQGQFALEGGGGAKCSAFVEAHDKRSPEVQLFLGWIDGYVTAANQLTPETFDLTPWQTGALLLDFAANYCRREPEHPFALAVSRVLGSLAPDRLRAPSTTVALQSGTRTVNLYEEVVRRAQQALSRRGYDVGTVDGAYGAKTRAAVEKFQTENRIEANGLLDQRTLFALLLQRPQQ
ncbi:peptidoglycan-binding domain-containing protein [Belnapia moabensis]|uniref:peptidoglycan-binding domain-containing protein n=1 Tax=Belnapia moabensis TaxID=365533 RepID=UPI00147059C3|nr:peptidoglycan-binding domain-containing protein [Belnapia moabensis]